MNRDGRIKYMKPDGMEIPDERGFRKIAYQKINKNWN